jgi:hypothetical protein
MAFVRTAGFNAGSGIAATGVSAGAGATALAAAFVAGVGVTTAMSLFVTTTADAATTDADDAGSCAHAIPTTITAIHPTRFALANISSLLPFSSR